MSDDVDFIISDIQKIERPPKPSKAPIKDPKKAQSKTKTFSIERSFVPEKQSQVHEQLRPEVQKLKMYLKAKKEKERNLKKLLAEGVITKDQFEGRDKEKDKKQEQDQQQQKYTVDESGQLRDQQGNLIFVKSQTSALLINQKKENELTAKQLSKKQKIKFHERLSRNLLDRNLVVSGSKKRIRRSMLGLQFLEKGSYQSFSSQVKTQINDLNEALKTETHDIRPIRKRQKTKLEFNRDVPKCQWWDREILKEQYLKELQAASETVKKEENSEKANIQQFIDLQKLSNEVVYQKVGDDRKESQIKMPVYLTKDQRKKLKRKRKREKLLQKNDMIKLGIIQPDKPKLKISNMAVVMKNQFIMDPSKVEAQAKKQQQERLSKHLQNNQQRKLSKSQKKDKIIRKLKRDSAKQCRRIVFRIEKLEDPTQIFKVNMNAKQLALNGFVLKPNEFHRQPVLVAAEGGQKAIRFFKNLMVNRIKWTEDGNNCKMIWEGQIENSKLGKWRTYEVGDQSETFRTLTEKGMQNFGQYIE